MAEFIDFDIETDEESLIELYNTQMEAEFPGWSSPPGSYEDWLARIWARMSVETAELAADVPGEIFYKFGETIVGIPHLLAAPAIASTEWTMRDDAGYTIYAGTLISIALSGNELIGFKVRTDTTIAPGDTVATAVSVEAVEPGEYANGASGSVELLDGLTFVESITLDAPASSGVDEEEVEDYLNRLRDELTLLAPRPILPRDVEVLARRIAGVERSLALDLYDADLETWDNARTVTVAVADADGEPLSTPVKDEVAALLEVRREINFVFYVIDPTYTTIKVEYDITVLSGYAEAAVSEQVEAAIANYLDPAVWGGRPTPSDDEYIPWSRSDSVYINELIALVDNVPGVDRVVTIRTAEESDSYGTATLTLDGPAALTRPGTIEAA